jgi:hypothetical protein
MLPFFSLPQRLFVGIAVIGVLSAFAAIQENQGVFHQRTKLYTGSEADPYVAYFPIEITHPGRITIRAKVTNYTSERVHQTQERPFEWMLVDSRFFDGKKPIQPNEFQQFMRQINQYNPAEYLAGDEIRSVAKIVTDAPKHVKNAVKYFFGFKDKKKQPPSYLHSISENFEYKDFPENHRIPFFHDVNLNELGETQGMYFLILKNSSRSLTPEFEFKLTFPGTQQSVDEEFLKPKDLSVTRIGLNENNQITVTVKNIGEGEITENIYREKGANAVNLLLQIDGKNWGGQTLQGFDPERKLSAQGGEATMTSNAKVTKKTTVKATLVTPNFKDADLQNNTIEQTLDPSGSQLRPVFQLK